MKIAVLISGGVDSAVVVHKLYGEGHELHLFYIRIGMDTDEGDCSAEEDIEICSLIARKYNLPFKVVNLQQEYWDNVMAYALDTVKKGLTPNPDILCNRIIKFGYFERLYGKDFDKTATGHYASVEEKDGVFYLRTAVDPVKDQTDFLARITQQQLSHLIFPLGDIPKSEVRRIASESALPNAGRKDSQGICFLGRINYNDFLKRKLGEKPGPIIEIETGRKIGTHAGYWFHTIGQRKGLGLSGGPWYVVKKNVRDNAIYVSHGFDTQKQYGRRFEITEMQWISVDPSQPNSESAGSDGAGQSGERVPVKIAFKNRHNPYFFTGTLIPEKEDGCFIIESDADVQGIAPGQFAAIYSADKRYCLGSGVISRQLDNNRHRHHSKSSRHDGKE